MPQSRTTGLLLLVVGMLTFSGTTNALLPAIAFWPAAVVCCFGIVIFMKANRVAAQAAEEAARRRVAQPLRNARVEGSSEAQARADGRLLESVAARGGRSAARPAAPQQQAQADEIVLYEVEDAQAIAHTKDFVVTTDVSFPLELQQQGALGDQLEKLDRLRDQGILSAEEFAIAKAKLLR